MPTIISGDGTITGLTSTGISAVQKLPSGTVLQVVQGSYGTETETSSNSYVDTGLSVSITPTSATSKILAILNMNGVGKNSNNTSARIALVRGSTNIGESRDIGFNNSTTANYIGTVDIIILDSPATTSATTYKAQFLSTGGTPSARICSSSSTATLTLMEIAV
jgi:hypothetical protein